MAKKSEPARNRYVYSHNQSTDTLLIDVRSCTHPTQHYENEFLSIANVMHQGLIRVFKLTV